MPLKDTGQLLKRNRLLAIVQERIPWALVDWTRVIERSAEIKPGN